MQPRHMQENLKISKHICVLPTYASYVILIYMYIYRYVINACGDIKTSKVSEPHSYFFWRSFSPKHHHVWIMVCLYTFTQNSADLGPQMQIIHILMIFHNFLSSQKTKSQNTQKKNYIAKTNIYNDP